MRLAHLVALGLGAFVCGASAASDGEKFFETNIRPLLAERCRQCHGPKQAMAGLDLSSAAGFAKGSDRGPVVAKGDPEGSRLWEVVSYQSRIKMPPDGKLKDNQLAALREWVRMGAPWPASETATTPASQPGARKVIPWSFQPPRNPVPPKVRNEAWVRNDVDRFLLAKLEESGLAPAEPADKLTLLRRATFDLTGLPPTEAEMRVFLDDRAPDAFARVVDRLLNSPRYGERWGRHWLDVARYADSTGADEDHRYPHAWRYRDYVIDAFNRDLPYDRFVTEQIAGDLLPADKPGEVNIRGIIATGFLALGPKLIAEQDKVKMLYDMIDEEIDVTGRAFLGLTLACARCHDHKFDPISTKDYYSLASIFASTKQLSKIEGTVSELYFAPLVPKDVADRYEAHQKKIQAKKEEINEVLADEKTRYAAAMMPRMGDYILAAWTHGDLIQGKLEGLDAAAVARWAEYLKPTQERRPHLERLYQAAPADLARVTREYQAQFETTWADWQAKLAAGKRSAGKTEKPKFLAGTDRFFYDVYLDKGPLTLPEKEREQAFTPESKSRLTALRAELDELTKTSPPQPPLACAAAEGNIVNQRVFLRGNPENKGDEVRKGFPLTLTGGWQPHIREGSGRRELARWIADADHPLTARVMVNRIWQWHFGEGLVRTPSNFGVMGEAPTHPELLDYLARRFVDSGWSVKAMHRLLMLSSAYRMSTQIAPRQWDEDPANRLWSHFQRRRLDVEEIRDSLLFLDKTLDYTMGGTTQQGEGTDKEFSDDRKSVSPDQSKRRTVYLPLRRSNLPSLLNLFDFGDATTTGEGRAQTNVAPQALFMMNSAFVSDRAAGLAKLMLGDSQSGDAARVERTSLTVLGRQAMPEEVRAALEYLRAYPGGKDAAWQSYCKLLLSSNDFIYVN